ncbi:hypothetical protein RFI_34933, partial [Reticulomyxa filosa]
SISIIQWNTKLHHDIPVQFQDIEDKGEEFKKQYLFDEFVDCWIQYLKIAINTFGLSHHYVAIAYNSIGNTYYDRRQNEHAIEFYEKVLQEFINIKSTMITLEIFGFNNDDVAYLFWTLGLEFETLGNYKTASGHFEGAWKTYTALFREWHIRTLQAKMKLSFFCLLANYGNPKVSIELFCFYSLVIFIVLLSFPYFFKVKI